MGVGSTKEFPYEIKESNSIYEGKSLWKLNNGVKKLDRNSVSILSFDPKKNANKITTANNYFKRLKTTRHPNVLPFLDGLELDATNPQVVYIVTEEVIPLEEYLNTKFENGETIIQKYPASIAWGFYQITKAISFLNNDCNLIHGNLSLNSIFVNKAGDWKLGGFDILSSVTDTSSCLRQHNDIVPSHYKSPEYVKNTWIDDSPSWAIDSWMLSTLIYEVYNGKFQKSEDLKKIGNIPKELIPFYQQMLTSSPKSRLNPQKFLESPYFSVPFVDTCIFLETIALKEAFEKEKFFKKLPKLIDEFPMNISKYKILPHLVSALDYGAANSSVIGPLLKIGKYLTAEEYSVQISPSVVKWFASNDRSLRMNLLQNLDQFIDYLSVDMVSDQIFPHVATGFMDVTSPALRDATIKSITVLIPKLSEKVVNTQVLKFLAKAQTDEEAGIRTNTTICIAKIASFISPQTRKKVLAPAFCRSLRDAFPKSRVSGLIAFMATENYYSKEELAQIVIPAISVVTIDQDKEVRDNAFKAIDIFLTKLKNISDSGIEENAEEAKTATNSTDGYLNWAIGSISKKIYGDQGTPTTPTISPAIPNKNHVAPQSPNDFITNSKPTSVVKSSSANFNDSGSDSEPKKVPKKESLQSKNEREEEEGWDEFDVDEKPTPKPTATKVSTETSAKSKKSSGWDDFDLEEEMKQESPKSKPQDKSGWDDDDDFDFEPPAKTITKLEQSKLKKTEKRTGKSD